MQLFCVNLVKWPDDSEFSSSCCIISKNTKTNSHLTLQKFDFNWCNELITLYDKTEIPNHVKAFLMK